MRRLIYICMIAFAGVQMNAQHYSLFSQYLVNGLVINPAYAGKNDVLDVSAMHRRQWSQFNGAPVTSVVSVNTPLRGNANNIGLVFQDDKLGVTTSQLVSGIYAYRFRFGETRVSLGLQAGLNFSRIRWDELRRNDAGDLLLATPQNTASFFAGSGVYVHNKKFFGGISAPWMYNSESVVNRDPLFISAGYLFSFGTDHSLKPSLLIRRTKGSPWQADLNASYYYRSLFGVGASFRMKESVVMIAEFNPTEQLKLSYSYDMGIGTLSSYHNGSHEFMLRYYFGYTKKARNPREFLY